MRQAALGQEMKERKEGFNKLQRRSSVCPLGCSVGRVYREQQLLHLNEAHNLYYMLLKSICHGCGNVPMTSGTVCMPAAGSRSLVCVVVIEAAV